MTKQEDMKTATPSPIKLFTESAEQNYPKAKITDA
jgi:hypothetical protein